MATDKNILDNVDTFRVWAANGKHKSFPDIGEAMAYYGSVCTDNGKSPWDASKGIVIAPGKILDAGNKVVDAPTVATVKVKATVKADAPKDDVPTDIVLRNPDGVVSAIALARVNADEVHLAAHGIVLPPTVYAPGMKVVGTGRENFRIERDKIDNLPAIEEALTSIIRTVKAENRHDVVISPRDLTMRDDGTLNVNGDTVYWEPFGFETFISHNRDVFPRGKEMMLALDPDIRAAAFNRQVRKDDAADKVRLRMRSINGKATIFATTTDSYTPVNLDRYVSDVLMALQGSGMRGEVMYDPHMTRLRVNAWLPMDAGDPDEFDLACGDVFKAGLTIRSSDSGVGGMRVDASFIRNLCLNLIILGEGKKDLLNQRHRGDKTNIGKDIQAAIRVAEDMFKPFRERWKCLRNTPIDELFAGNDINDIAMQVAPSLDLGLKDEVVASLIADTYNAEPGDSMADLMNAITRLHTKALIDDALREKVEVRAGRLLDDWSRKAGLKAMPLAK